MFINYLPSVLFKQLLHHILVVFILYLCLGCTHQKHNTTESIRGLSTSHVSDVQHKMSLSVCDTASRRSLFLKMQTMITNYVKSFDRFMRPFGIMPVSPMGQLQKAHYTIQFSQGLLERLNVLQAAFSSCPKLQKEFKVYRNKLANRLGQSLHQNPLTK